MIDDERLKDLKESVEFFGNNNKVERDKLLVRYFLEILRVGFDGSDLQPPPEYDPIDIRFAGAEFQIKEILDRGRLRHKEYQETLNNALAISESRTLLLHSTPRDITLTEIYSEILFFISSHKLLKKYAPAVCRGLDLLFYVNLLDVYGLVETPYPDISEIRSQPWRSVSFLKGTNRACVLFARDDAPAFLRNTMGKVSHR